MDLLKKHCIPTSNFSGLTSTPIILVAPQSLAPSATYETKQLCDEYFDRHIHLEEDLNMSVEVTM